MDYHVEKDFKSNYVRGEKIYILVKNVNTNLKSKPKHISPEKCFFFVHPNSGS